MWAFRAVRLGGRMAAGDALPRLLLGERAVLLAAVAGVTLVAWLYLLHLGHDMGGMADMGGMPDMAGMAMAPGWTPATAVLPLAMWVVMMTGLDRKSVVEGKSVSGRVELRGSRIIKKKKSNK